MTQALGKARSDNGQNRLPTTTLAMEVSFGTRQVRTTGKGEITVGLQTHSPSLSPPSLRDSHSCLSVSPSHFPGSRLLSITHAHNALLGR